jgi:hypothetical protein
LNETDPATQGIGGAAHAPCWQISVSALGDGEEEDPEDEAHFARLGLVFSHTPTYPDTPPLIKCRSIKGLFDSELKQIQAMMVKQAAESVGMSMIFDLVAGIGYVDHTGVVTLKYQIGYVDHTGCHQLNRVLRLQK